MENGKIKIKSITLTRAEGRTTEVGRPNAVACYTEADLLLLRWSHTAPKGGGYDKCDFVIDYEDGKSRFLGRYDLKHFEDEIPDLRASVRAMVDLYGKGICPPHITPERHQVMLSRISPEHLRELQNFAQSCEY